MSSVRRPHGRLFQIRGPAAPKLLSPKLLCVHGTAHVIRRRPKGLSIAFGDEMDIISQVRTCRHLTAQCLAHQTREFELHSPPNKKPVQLTQHRRNVVTTYSSGYTDISDFNEVNMNDLSHKLACCSMHPRALGGKDQY